MVKCFNSTVHPYMLMTTVLFITISNTNRPNPNLDHHHCHT